MPISRLLTAIVVTMAMFNADAASLPASIAKGKFHLDFRYRLESVDQDNLAKQAMASTLRTRINYATDTFNGFSAFIEVDNVVYLGDETFNNTRNGQSQYPIVADPDGTDLNQLYITYRGEEVASGVGRQRVNLDNQRFVGGVGWRQNEQTYDVATLDFSGLEKAKLFYGYIDRIARIFGPDEGVPPSSLDSSSHIVNASYDAGKLGHFVGYGYFLDLENAPSSSSRTLGIRYTNTIDRAESKIPLLFEFANQNDFADNPVGYGASYVHAEVGFKKGPAGLFLGEEILGADKSAGVAFATPLATLHKFQGWADKFLTTPSGGVNDRYIKATMTEGDASFMFVWHDFEADADSTQYGNEFDLSVGYKFDKRLQLLVKYANYNAQTFSINTQKFWVMLSLGL